MVDVIAIEATEEKYRILRHEPTGAVFDADGKSQWPSDQFTHRLIAEGSVRIVSDALAPDKRSAGSDADTSRKEK
jgi:hypothetical protein